MATFRQRPAVPAVEASLDATVIQPRGGPLAPGPGQPARLLVVSGPRAGIVVALGHGELTFGRGWDNDVVLPDVSVSRRHALLRRDGREYVLLDQGSGNGTSVNGRAVEKVRLRDGDEISLGDSVVRFVASGAMAVRGNAAAVREPRRAGARAAACAGVAAFLLGATVVGLRQGQAEPGGPSNVATALRPQETEAQAASTAPAEPEPVLGGSREEAAVPPRSARGKRSGPTAAGTRSARERLDSAWREGIARRDEGRAAAKAIGAPEHADATDRAAGARRDSEGLAALVAEAGEAYRSGYVAKDIDPDAARRAFRLVVALLPPGDETALKARRWLDRLEGRTLAEEEPSP